MDNDREISVRQCHYLQKINITEMPPVLQCDLEK